MSFIGADKKLLLVKAVDRLFAGSKGTDIPTGDLEVEINPINGRTESVVLRPVDPRTRKPPLRSPSRPPLRGPEPVASPNWPRNFVSLS